MDIISAVDVHLPTIKTKLSNQFRMLDAFASSQDRHHTWNTDGIFMGVAKLAEENIACILI